MVLEVQAWKQVDRLNGKRPFQCGKPKKVQVMAWAIPSAHQLLRKLLLNGIQVAKNPSWKQAFASMPSLLMAIDRGLMIIRATLRPISA